MNSSRPILLAATVLTFAVSFPAGAADLASASPDDLKAIYSQLRHLRAGEQWVEAENAVLKRDAGTFTFRSGKLVFAAPVNGRVFAAAFEGEGTFQLDPPGPIHRAQIARFTQAPRLTDSFRKAVFFFTDDSYNQLLGQMKAGTGGAPPTGAIADSQKDFSENHNDWWWNVSKHNFDMGNMAARMLADLADPSSKGFFLADFKADKAGDLVFHVSWNRDPLLLQGNLNDEEVMLIHYSRGNWFEWWSGFHLAEEYAKNPHPEHRALLVRCPSQTITAAVADDNRFSATTEMDYEVLRGSPRLLPLYLRGVLRISSVEDGEGNPINFIQEPRELDNEPWIILPAPSSQGVKSRLKITYAEDSTQDSRIIHQRGAGLYYVTARESWYPHFGAFDDKTQFSLRFRSPKKFTFVATGQRLKAEKAKDELNSEWQSEVPYAVAGFNYGSFAEKSRSDAALTVTAYSGKEVPDELKGIQNALALTDLASGPDRLRNAGNIYGITEGGFNTSRLVGEAADISYGAYKLFEYYFGPLPFKSVSVTQQPVGYYGQSWPTLIYLPYTSFLDSGTRHQLRMDYTPDAIEFFNTVAPHEMAHQWWGHLVGWKTYHDVWLSEGFSEFAAALWLSKAEPNKMRAFWDLKRRRILEKTSKGHRPNDVGPLWLSYQLPAYLEEQLYLDLIYFKGAYVLEMLRMMMWDPRLKDPDARFITMMRDFSATYAGKNASTEDFRRVVEKHRGQPMDWFFNQWVYGTEIPSYKLQYQLKDAGNGRTNLSFQLSQSGVSSGFRGSVPIDLILKKGVMRLGLISVVGSNTTSDEVPLPFRPEKVVLDEGHSVLCGSRD